MRKKVFSPWIGNTRRNGMAGEIVRAREMTAQVVKHAD